ncbi:Lipoyltransferase 1, mitochondrial [Strongyloides ratti]|uniref:Lipoyltransferase 1, mitochondrial n=1 Tax=Strongyloides ratti TaxID=34506 RepID=A0A090L852_STRRB|nr:Lipoyltransferase 1, mitochondrial [Strongyloides ratti]CEF64283.1 Lipoyltransferase 1, mitochondrial [Strongyloides ratti]
MFQSIKKNLAYEEKLFRTHDLSKGNAIFMWSNTPSIVIGRHQNPWLEINIPHALENKINIARRHSGGGTVYHDLGNLNISILTEHSYHCRPKNLTLLSNILNNKYKINIIPNKRDDMILNPGERKISGTAARISKGRAYHHLTLLVDVNLITLKNSLKSPWVEKIETNATRSVPAKAVGFLGQEIKNITVEDVKETLVDGLTKENGGKINIFMVNPNNDEEIDVEDLKLLKSWDWIYGKTPKFTYIYSNEKIPLKIEKGRIKDLDNELPQILPE